MATTRLRKAFAESGYTLGELADAAQMSEGSIGPIIRGQRIPLLRTQHRIAKALSLKLGRPIDIDALWPTREDAEATL